MQLKISIEFAQAARDTFLLFFLRFSTAQSISHVRGPKLPVRHAFFFFFSSPEELGTQSDVRLDNKQSAVPRPG